MLVILKLWIDPDEIYSPDPVLKLCLDIFLVREQKNFKLEEILVGKHFPLSGAVRSVHAESGYARFCPTHFVYS